MKTTKFNTRNIFGISNLISIILITVFSFSMSQTSLAGNLNDESSTILIEAATYNEVAYGFVQCDNGVSTTEIKKGVVKTSRTARSTEFSFEHDENVEINFKLKLNENGTFKWNAKNTNPTEEFSLLGLEKTNGIGNSISFIAENKSNKPKTITIEVTPLYNDENGLYEGNTERFIINVCPKIAPTFEVAPKDKEADNYAVVEYSTQEEFSNYKWSFSGVREKDYTIISGGTNKDHNVNLIWLSKGEKKVEVSYESTSGKTSQAPAIASISIDELGEELKVGDSYQGGIIYEVFGTPGKQWGTIIANEDLCSCAWINDLNSEMTVKEMCANYLVNENESFYDDWYLPAIHEIKKAHSSLPSFVTGTFWSSSESKRLNNHAIILSENGKIGIATKESVYTSNKVRPIRKFTYKNNSGDHKNISDEMLATVK